MLKKTASIEQGRELNRNPYGTNTNNLLEPHHNIPYPIRMAWNLEMYYTGVFSVSSSVNKE